MRLREEMKQRANAVGDPGTPFGEPLINGWAFTSEEWPETTQDAVDAVMTTVNTLLDMTLRLAEAVDELRDALDAQGHADD